MPDAQRAELDKALRALPNDQPFTQSEDAFFISWDDHGTWRTRIYDQSHLPREVWGVCRLVSIPPTWIKSPRDVSEDLGR